MIVFEFTFHYHSECNAMTVSLKHLNELILMLKVAY